MPITIEQDQDLQWILDKLAGRKTTVKATSVRKPVSTVKLTPPKFIPAPNSGPSLLPPKGSKMTKEELASTKTSEIELWKKWKSGGHKPQDLDPLLHSMKRLVESKSRTYKNNVEIPTAAIDMEYKQRLVDALKSYDPSKGALGTWVGVYLKKASRYIVENQNFARIPESLANHIGRYQKVKESLTEELGHEPDDITLADHTGISLKDIKRLNKEIRKGYIQTEATQDFINPVNFSDREREVIRLIYPRLSPDERKVHELTFGLNGKASFSPGQIATKLKMDSSKVAKLRTSIYSKMKPYLPE